MDFTWTAHRFSGGALALDVANTVILRHDAQRSQDRFADAEIFRAFVPAALQFGADRDQHREIKTTGKPGGALIALRECIDAHFRKMVLAGGGAGQLPGLLRAAADALEKPGSLECATARSALHLAFQMPNDRIKCCQNCGWLFVDQSKNKSRIWCDMRVCGNRQKARNHYRRNMSEGQ